MERVKSQSKYTLKNNKSFDDLYALARSHFQIPERALTFTGHYNGHPLAKSFINLEAYAIKQKEIKKSIQVYIYYPKSLKKLELEKLLEKRCTDTSVDGFSDFADFPEFLHTSLHQTNTSLPQPVTSRPLTPLPQPVTPLPLTPLPKADTDKQSSQSNICNVCGCTTLNDSRCIRHAIIV